MATKTILLGIEVRERIWVSGRDAGTYAIRNAQKYCRRTTLTRASFHRSPRNCACTFQNSLKNSLSERLQSPRTPTLKGGFYEGKLVNSIKYPLAYARTPGLYYLFFFLLLFLVPFKPLSFFFLPENSFQGLYFPPPLPPPFCQPVGSLLTFCKPPKPEKFL